MGWLSLNGQYLMCCALVLTDGCAPSIQVERAAATHFGIKAYGVHINGCVDLNLPRS